MKKKQRKRKQNQSQRVAVHTSPYLASSSIPEMEQLLHDSLLDAFLPKILYVAPTDEKASERVEEVRTDPYWQSRYRSESEKVVIQKYGGALPIMCQYQTDSSTMVSCLKVDRQVSFETVFHVESTHPVQEGKLSPNFDASEIFFAMSSEEDTPTIRTWTDIRWDEIGVISKGAFQHFVKILLNRLTPVVLAKWEKGGNGHVSAQGYDQEILKGTYFDLLKEKAKKEGKTE